MIVIRLSPAGFCPVFNAIIRIPMQHHRIAYSTIRSNETFTPMQDRASIQHRRRIRIRDDHRWRMMIVVLLLLLLL
jgi:hypothetical protein